jgi:hypothetical protein
MLTCHDIVIHLLKQKHNYKSKNATMSEQATESTVSKSATESTEPTMSKLYGVITTDNQLRDIIGWLKLGHHVVLTSKYNQRMFFGNEAAQNEYEKITIQIRCEQLPGLLDEGEWEWYITDAGHKEHKITDENKEETYAKINGRKIIGFVS